MHIIVLLLLFANITLFAYTKLDSGGGEGVRLTQQVQPEKIRLLSTVEVAALGSSKVAALYDLCVELGPLSDGERGRALAELEPLALGRVLSQKRVDADGAYWVNLSPFPSRAAADKRMAELRVQGVRDSAVVDVGRGQSAISFGVFRTESAAVAHAESLGRLGVQLTKVEPRPPALIQTILVVRDPQQTVVARLRELQAQFPGSELKTGACT